MSGKLFKLKEWITIPEVAKHLTIVLGEPVEEHDVLRLALDRHLVLSVILIEPVHGRVGWYIRMGKAMTHYVGLGKNFQPKSLHERPYGDESPLADEIRKGLETGDIQQLMPNVIHPQRSSLFNRSPEGSESLIPDDWMVIEFTDRFPLLTGIHDLPLLGGELNEIETQYQKLTGGKMNRFLADVKPIVVKGFDEDKSPYYYILHGHAEDVLDHQDVEEPRDKKENFFPLYNLPMSSQLVVRTSELRKFESEIADKNLSGELQKKERNNLHNIIGGLLEMLRNKGEKQESIIVSLINEHKDVSGMSDRNLQQVFAAANKAIKGG